jgi:hypothetical protein
MCGATDLPISGNGKEADAYPEYPDTSACAIFKCKLNFILHPICVPNTTPTAIPGSEV